jgi:segregation and condensation protein A
VARPGDRALVAKLPNTTLHIQSRTGAVPSASGPSQGIPSRESWLTYTHYQMSTEPAESPNLAAEGPGLFPVVPQQQELPLAIVRGEPLLQMPRDLYIPPDALEVILESFAGPLDLLLYLIRRQNLDILDIPIAEITRQYMGYIELMHEVMRFELAAEYLLMAAILAEIKSRLLLPRPPLEEGLEEDPRAELVRRLQEYERFKRAAEDIDALPRMERDTVVVHADPGERNVVKVPPPLELTELLLALQEVLNRAQLFEHHAVKREGLSVRQRMGELLSRLDTAEFQAVDTFFDLAEGRAGIVVTFLAMLELAKEMLVEIIQDEPGSPIYLRAKASEASATTDVDDSQSPAADESGATTY